LLSQKWNGKFEVNCLSGGYKNFQKTGDRRQCVSRIVIIANAHNELYVFYTGKTGFLKKF